MADFNRSSGRQPAATSTSGRQASPSGRMAAQPSPSGRMPASASGRSTVPAPRTPSGRLPRESTRESGVKKKGRGGPELLIAFAVIALLAVAAMFLAFKKKSKESTVYNEVRKRQEQLDANFEAAFKAFKAAEGNGLMYVVGKEEFNADKHFGSLRSDPVIYNVVFEKTYKDKRAQMKTDQKALYPEKLTIANIDSVNRADQGVLANYALADNKTLPVVIAKKNIKGVEGDNTNLGGTVIVIVKAPEKDHNFENALNPKPKTEEKK